MARKKELIEKRNKQIAKRYMHYHNQGFRHEICCQRVADEFYLASGTIERIVTAEKHV